MLAAPDQQREERSSSFSWTRNERTSLWFILFGMDPSKKQAHLSQAIAGRWLEVEEVRLVSDLRIMHSKVDELFQIVKSLRERHDGESIRKYADPPVLEKDIARVDDIYLWFLALKENRR